MTTENETREVKGFDFNNYIVSKTPDAVTVEVPGTTDSFEVLVKPLSWSKRNQIISKNLNWDATGSTSFNADGYVRDCLKEMVTEAPWGRTTETFLLSIDDKLGAALETLVPKAFGTGEDDTIGMDSDTVKKE
tara:strand:+ start:518 stop:916 length:399 start_codon:yes stop_codon:yes gene_type:complete